MSNPAKAKGTRFETDVVGYLREHGHPDARRIAQTGRLDTGDVWVAGWTLQAKAWRDLVSALREGVDGAIRQARQAGSPYGAAVVKRPRRSTADAYVVLPLSEFARLLGDLRTPDRPGGVGVDARDDLPGVQDADL